MYLEQQEEAVLPEVLVVGLVGIHPSTRPRGTRLALNASISTKSGLFFWLDAIQCNQSFICNNSTRSYQEIDL